MAKPTNTDERIPSLWEGLSKEDVLPERLKAQDYVDEVIIIHDVDFAKGELGDYVVMQVTLKSNPDEIAEMTSGAWQVKQICRALQAINAFPRRAKLVANGKRSYTLEDPEDDELPF